MSQITADAAGHASDHHGAEAPSLAPENITLPAGGGNTLSMGLFVLGAIGLAVAAIGAVTQPMGLRQALAGYHIGAMSVLAVCLGAMFWVLVFHLTQAGWSATLRRQFENVMSLTPIAVVMVLPVLAIELLNGGILFAWMNPDVVAGDPLYEEKSVYFTFGVGGAPWFFILRAVIYAVVLTVISRKLWGYSVEQDRTGDKTLSNRAQATSAWGMLLFALTTAFLAFDWLMTLDYRFFSTMWGVYYFAGCAFASVSLLTLVLALLRRSGRLRGLVTVEHFHDLGKLMFGFTVFWAYIAFSQYFLIWYSNIPEETSFFLARKEGGWEHLSALLVWGHFLVPFFILLWRWVRRSPGALAVIAVWLLVMQVADLYWVVRPMVFLRGMPGVEDPVQIGRLWLDLAPIVGVTAIFGGLLVRKIYSGVLIPVHDPRLPEALHHRNYV